jgi:hypothetical protein
VNETFCGLKYSFALMTPNLSARFIPAHFHPNEPGSHNAPREMNRSQDCQSFEDWQSC